MIREEYFFKDIECYLDKKVDLVITGLASEEDRSHFFFDKWCYTNKMILILESVDLNDKIKAKLYRNGTVLRETTEDLLGGIPRLLKEIDISKRVVLMDLSGLSNVVIMILTKQLLIDCVPKDFFAAYIRPITYCNSEDTIGVGLSCKVNSVGSVPGFVRRESDNQILCAFVGFEGIRLTAVLETIQKVNRIIPIVAFPSGTLDWYNISMWNIMDVLQNETDNLTINKCLSESLFDAVNLLYELVEPNEKVVLAPLGTRVHSMACAVYACKNNNARIVYDFVTEKKNRAVGIADIVVYHMAMFISV